MGMQAGGTLKTAAESASKLDIVLERDSTDEDVDVKMEAKALGLPLKFSGAFVHGTNLSQKSPISAPLQDLQQKTIGNLELKGNLVQISLKKVLSLLHFRICSKKRLAIWN